MTYCQKLLLSLQKIFVGVGVVNVSNNLKFFHFCSITKLLFAFDFSLYDKNSAVCFSINLFWMGY